MTAVTATAQNRHRVLLVDDDAISLELMSLLLAHEGHQVLRAQNADAALHLLANGDAPPPDVMLVDLQMPGVSGGELAQSVRALGRKEPLLLAMSATRVQQKNLLAFDGFLLKPLAVEDLRAALKPRQGRAALRVPAQRKTSSSAAEILDLQVVNKLLTMMPMKALVELIQACLADTRNCIQSMDLMVREGDQAGLVQSAHRIKGAALMIGATRLAEIAGYIELGSGKEAATPAVLTDLLNACTALEGMLLEAKFKVD